MHKLLSVYRISFRQEFAYKLSFVMWRVRNIMQILVFFFLWNAVFLNDNEEIFNYTKSEILTYAFALIIVRAITLSSRSIDISAQIADGDLINYLLKPVNFFRYWAIRDVSSKVLNIIFGLVEVTVLILILKPPIFLQSSPFYLFFFLVSLIVAGILFFNIIMLTNFVSFWIPELHWGSQFLVIVIFVEFLSGAFFPLNILPDSFYQILKLTPFPYLIYIPIQIFLGNFSYTGTMFYIFVGGVWSILLFKLVSIVWKKGLMVYEGIGR